MGKYITKQRKVLQEYLSQHLDEELSAKIVADDLQEQNVSVSAIYRNLADMEKEQLVVQYHKEGSREVFFRYVGVSTCQESLHLVCKVCSKTEHMSMKESKFFKEKVFEQFNFLLDLPSTICAGVCRNCRNSL